MGVSCQRCAAWSIFGVGFCYKVGRRISPVPAVYGLVKFWCRLFLLVENPWSLRKIDERHVLLRPFYERSNILEPRVGVISRLITNRQVPLANHVILSGSSAWAVDSPDQARRAKRTKLALPRPRRAHLKQKKKLSRIL